MSNRSLSGKLVMTFALAVCASAQTKGKTEMSTIKMTRCAEPIPAYGEHVRWTSDEHIQLLLDMKKQSDGQRFPYLEWELASRELDWFGGSKRVPLSEIKSRMPRAMLLELKFPVDQNPPVDPKGLQRLIDAEKAYNSAANGAQDFATNLMKKYGIGPQAVFDEDFGGATPMEGCARYEEFDYVLPEGNNTR